MASKLTILMLLLCIPISSPHNDTITSSKKLLEQKMVALPPGTEIKCGSCPCGDTCGEQLPPPPTPPLPPPSPPPPSPCPPPPSPPPPPPPPKYPSCQQNCNPMPPPPPRFIYVPVPGQVYQPKPYTWVYYYSGAENRGVGLLVLVCLGAISITTVFG